MLGTLRAFAYLTWHMQRNRLLTRVRRARNPRYAISAAIGLAYMWFFLIRNPSRLPREVGSMLNDSLVVLGTIGLITFASTWWLFGGDQTTLTFTLPEIAFLFPAPLSRRAIIGYRLFRAQLSILINNVIFIFLMRRGIGYLPPGYRAISLWVLFTTLNFHRIGAALVRASWVEHRRHAVRRNVIPTAVLVTVILGVIVTGFDGWEAVRRAFQEKGFLDAIGTARLVLGTPPASLVLWPVHAVLTPVFAMSRYEWAAAIPFGLLVLLLHAWWVLSTDAAFEESAIAASHERVRRLDAFRSRRMSAPRTETISRRGLRLPQWGHPAIAIVWKNVLCLRRTLQIRIFLFPLIFSAMWGALFGTGRGILASIAFGAASLAGLLTFFGPMLVRNDLRQDMQNLLALKVLPLRGRTIVMAEVMSSAIPVAITQYGALVIAGIAASFMQDPVPAGVAIGVVLAAFPALLAVAAAMIVVQNGAPVLFPGWVRLGAVVDRGMDNLGQGVMTMGIILVLVALMLVVPAILAAGAILTLKSVSWAIAIVVAILIGTVALGFETYLVFDILGRALERTEPSETAYA